MYCVVNKIYNNQKLSHVRAQNTKRKLIDFVLSSY